MDCSHQPTGNTNKSIDKVTESSLDNKTPSEMCGIEIKGENKWVTLIQNATRNQ